MAKTTKKNTSIAAKKEKAASKRSVASNKGENSLGQGSMSKATKNTIYKNNRNASKRGFGSLYKDI